MFHKKSRLLAEPPSRAQILPNVSVNLCKNRSAYSQINTVTAEEVAEICVWDRNEPKSDIDSVTGGISSGEEFELDCELEGSSDSEEELR